MVVNQAPLAEDVDAHARAEAGDRASAGPTASHPRGLRSLAEAPVAKRWRPSGSLHPPPVEDTDAVASASLAARPEPVMGRSARAPSSNMRLMTDGDENAYDAFAQAYAKSNESNAWNAHYERPAILRLVGDVAGRRVLDAGCGAGAHTAALVERGGQVIGVDSSAGLLAIAADRLQGAARFEQADLRDPLPFDDRSFDVVMASLVMHYLPDWAPTLREFHRVLVSNGRLIISTHHPFMDHALAGGDDYFATYDFVEEWRKGDHPVRMRFWHRPLSAMTRALHDADFTLDAIDEPQPDPAVRELDPDAWLSLTTEPRFIFFVTTAAPGG